MENEKLYEKYGNKYVKKCIYNRLKKLGDKIKWKTKINQIKDLNIK